MGMIQRVSWEIGTGTRPMCNLCRRWYSSLSLLLDNLFSSGFLFHSDVHKRIALLRYQLFEHDDEDVSIAVNANQCSNTP